MWYVIQVMSGEEHEKEQLFKKLILNRDGRTCDKIFVPMYVRKKRYQGKWHEEQKVLFPGYIFVDTSDIELFCQYLAKVPGFKKVLRDADEIAPITEEEKDYLLSMMDEHYIVQISVGYLIGDKICITEGALKNYQGSIYRIDRHRRTAQLMVNLFGRQTKVEVGLEVIQKYSEEEYEELREEPVQDVFLQGAIQKNSLDSGDFDSAEYASVISGVFAGSRCRILENNKKEKTVKASVDVLGTPATVAFRYEELKALSKSEV